MLSAFFLRSLLRSPCPTFRTNSEHHLKRYKPRSSTVLRKFRSRPVSTCVLLAPLALKQAPGFTYCAHSMHTSSRSVVTPLPGAPAVRSPSALPGNAKRELKEALDHFHVAAEYAAERIASAPASEPLRFTCRLRVPALVKPGGEVLLKECQFTALGRGKGEAEQKCAQQALAHMAIVAPHLRAKEA